MLLTLQLRDVVCTVYISVSQPLGCGPVPGLGISYTGPREILLEFVIFMNKYFILEIF